LKIKNKSTSLYIPSCDKIKNIISKWTSGTISKRSGYFSAIIVVFAFIITGTVFGMDDARADSGSDPALDLFNDLQEYIDIHMEECVEKYEKLPSSATNLFKNEEFLVTIKLNNGDFLRIKAVKQDTDLVEFRQLTEGEEFNPSIRVSTDEDTVRDIISSDTDRQAFTKGIKALDDETIQIKIHGLFKTVVFWVVEKSISFALEHNLPEYAIIEQSIAYLFNH
jgi:hypothetical protein